MPGGTGQAFEGPPGLPYRPTPGKPAPGLLAFSRSSRVNYFHQFRAVPVRGSIRGLEP